MNKSSKRSSKSANEDTGPSDAASSDHAEGPSTAVVEGGNPTTGGATPIKDEEFVDGARADDRDKRVPANSWKEDREAAVAKSGLLTVRNPIVQKSEHKNAFYIDSPPDCTTWYTLTCLSADFSTKAAIPKPGKKGVLSTTKSGQFETAEVSIADGTISVVCRAISVRNSDGKESGMAGLEVQTQPAHGPVVTLDDATGKVHIAARQDLPEDEIDGYTFEWVLQSKGDWAPYTSPISLIDCKQSVLLARAQTVWCTRSAAVQLVVSQAPPPRMLAVVDKPTEATTAYRVFNGDIGNDIRVFYAWDTGGTPVPATTASPECVDDVIEVDLHRGGKRTLCMLVTQPKRIPVKTEISLDVSVMPPPALGNAEGDASKGLHVAVRPPVGFPSAKMYYSWIKTAVVGGGCSRVVGPTVPVLTNRTGARTLSVIATCPGHVTSSAEKGFDIDCTAAPTIAATAHPAELSEAATDFGITELIGSYEVTLEHDNPFANIVFCITAAIDGGPRKPTLGYKGKFTVEADRNQIVSASATAPGEGPSSIQSKTLAKLVTSVNREQAPMPTMIRIPRGVKLESASHTAEIHYAWTVNGTGNDEQTVCSGSSVLLDASVTGTHVLNARVSDKGLTDSPPASTSITVERVPEPKVLKIDRTTGVHLNALVKSVAPSDVDVQCAFGVTRKGGHVTPTDSTLTWVSVGAADPNSWRSVTRDQHGKLKPVPFHSAEYLPDTSRLDTHGAYLHIWARSLVPGWAPSKIYTHPPVKMSDMVGTIDAVHKGGSKLKASVVALPIEMMPPCFHKLSLADGKERMADQQFGFGFDEAHIMLPNPEGTGFVLLTTSTATHFLICVSDKGLFEINGKPFGSYKNITKFVAAVTTPGAFTTDLGRPVLNELARQQAPRTENDAYRLAEKQRVDDQARAKEKEAKRSRAKDEADRCAAEQAKEAEARLKASESKAAKRAATKSKAALEQEKAAAARVESENALRAARERADKKEPSAEEARDIAAKEQFAHRVAQGKADFREQEEQSTSGVANLQNILRSTPSTKPKSTPSAQKPPQAAAGNPKVRDKASVRVKTSVVTIVKGQGEKWGFGLGKNPAGVAVVTRIGEDGAAKKVAEMVPGARIIRFNGKSVLKVEMAEIIATMKAQRSITLTVLPPP